MSKKWLILTCTVFACSLCNDICAQEEVSQNVLSIGAGYSLWHYFHLSEAENIQANPVITAAFDMDRSNRKSIGITASFHNISYVDSTGTQRSVRRNNFAVRGLVHLKKSKDKLNPYLGVRAGLSRGERYVTKTIWTTNTITIGGSSVSVRLPSGSTIAKEEYTLPSLRLLFGIRAYLNDDIGFHIESGIGAPYVVNAGISFLLE